MKRSNQLSLGIGIGVIVITILINQFAPPLAIITNNDTISEGVQCLTHAQADCLSLPAVTGIRLDNSPVAIPAIFNERYQLIVMPFDRDQQVQALTWLPIFQQLATEQVDIDYFSIGALPDLSPAIRFLVIGGMNTGISDVMIRERVFLLFLQDQQAFLQALAIPDTEQIQIFIVDQVGIVYYRDEGLFSESAGEALRTALLNLP